jgi:hypothetical protein
MRRTNVGEHKKEGEEKKERGKGFGNKRKES